MANELITAEELGNLGIDPKTGMSTSTTNTATTSKDTLYAEDLTDIKPTYINPISAVTVGGGEFLRSPEDYDFDVVYGQDNANVRAENQSTAGLIGKSVGRLVSTAGTKLLQGAGFSLGLAMGTQTGDLNMAFDNGISAMFGDAETWLKEEAMPVYKTKEYLNSGNLLDQMFGKGSSAFWADDAIDGVAFLASAYLQGMGVQNLAKGAFLNTARNLSKLTTAAKTGKFVEGSAMNVKKIADVMDYAAISAVNSANEAAFEARDTKDAVYNSLSLQRELGLMSAEESNERASNAAKTTFGLNMGALFIPNMIEARMMFKTPESLGMRGLINQAQGNVVEGSVRALNKKQLAGIFAKDALLSAAIEGPYEENIQTAIQNYSERKALGKENRNVIQAVAENMVDNFSTLEGQKSIALGSLLGLIPGGMGGVSSAKAAVRNDNAVLAARGAMLQRMQGQAQDYYKKQPIKDEKGKTVGESDAVVIDSNGKPVFDEGKIAAAFEKQYQTYTDMTEMLRASANGNTSMFNYVRHNRFADAIMPLLATNATEKEISDTVDFYAGGEIEDLQRAGKAYDPASIEELKKDYKQTALDLKCVYDSIQNNHAGTYDFGNSAEDARRRDGLVMSQYYEAADQVFWEKEKEKVLKLNNDTKAAEQIDKVLEDSRTKMKDLLNYDKQQDLYNQYKKEKLAKADQTIINNSEAEQEVDNIASSEVNDHKVVLNNDSTSSVLFTNSSAEGLGYNKSSDKPNYFVKEDKENGRTSTITTDQKGYIKVSTDTIGKDMIDPYDGTEHRATVVFRNGKLDAIATTDSEGNVNYSVLPDVESVDHEGAIREVLDKLPEVLGLQYIKPLNVQPTREERKKEKLVEPVSTTNPVDPNLGKADFSKDNTKLKDLTTTKATLGNEVGTVTKDNDSVVFTDNLGNTTVLGNASSNTTVGDAGLTILKDSIYDIKPSVDSNSIELNGRKLNFTGPNKRNSIANGKVELIGEDNTKVTLSDPELVADITKVVEDEIATENEVFDSILSDNKDSVIVKDDKDGREYAVYHKDGDYHVTDLSGRPIRTEAGIYKRVVENTISELRKVTDLYKNSGKSSKVKNEIVDSLTGIRRTTSEEALKLPSKNEVTFPKNVVFNKGEGVNTQLEADLKAESIAKAIATSSVIEEENSTLESQKDIYNGESIIEAIDNEITDPNYQVLVAEHGVRDSSSSAAYVWYDKSNNKYVTSNPTFEVDVINEEEVNKLSFTSGIDFDYAEFWDAHKGLKEKVKSANTKVAIDSLLEVTDTLNYNNIVDILPISISLGTEKVYMHRTGYDYIKIPKNIMDAGPKAIAEYKINIKLQTRKVRRQILESLLKGGKVTLPIVEKTKGVPNTTPGAKNNIGTLLNTLEPTLDLRTVTLGVAVSDGSIMTANGELGVGFGKPGNVFLQTTYTANGSTGIFKLNPSTLTEEHAALLFDAYKQAMTKGSGGFKGEFKHELVEGLTIGKAIDLLVRQGETFTNVSGNKVKQHLLPKQLWSKDGILYFGTDTLNILEATKEDVGRFIKWATTNKRYSINKDLLGKSTNKTAFKIGSLSYDPTIDNYNSMLIKNNMITTDLNIVEGTKSLTKQPVVIFDASLSGIQTELSASEIATDVIDGDKVSFVNPDTKPEVKVVETTATVAAPIEIKETITTINQQAAEAQEGLPIGKTFKKIATMPEGSKVYFLSEVDGKKVKDTIGTIKNGKFNINVAQQGMYSFFAGSFAKIGSFKQDDVNKIAELAKSLFIMSANIKYDTPAVTVATNVQAEVKNVEIQQSTPVEEKPIVEEKPTTTFKNTGARNLNNLRKPFGLRLRTLAPEHYNVGDVVKATEWLQKTFKVNRFGKGIEVEQVEKLIEIAGDRLAFGQFKRDAFVLSKQLEVGTEYHEAFHRVSLGYLSDTERKAIYDQARKEKPGTDNEIEERLAEQFRDYMMLKDVNVEPKSIKGKIKDFFQKLYDFITTWFTGKHKLSELTTEALFKAVKNGKFQYAKINQDRYKALRGTVANFEVKGKQLNAVKNNEEFREVVQGLFYTLVESNGLVNYNPEDGDGGIRLSNLEDIKSLKLTTLLDSIIEDRDNVLSVANNVSNDLGIAKNKPSKEQLLDIKENVIGDISIADKDVIGNLENIITTTTKMGNILAEVVDNFDVYSEALQDFMMSLNVSSHTDKSDIDDTEVDEEDGSNASDFDKYNKVHFESSAKHNTAANIKLLLSVLPASTERSELTGMYKFAEYGKLWSKLQRDLSGFITAEDMMAKLKAKAEGYVPYSVLVKHLEKDETLKTQFYVSAKKSRLDFVNALIELVDNKPSFVFSNAAVQTATTKMVKEWNTSFTRNNSLFIVADEISKPNAEYFNSLTTRYESLYRSLKSEFDNKGIIEDLEGSKDAVLELLQQVGVTISTNEFDTILNSIDVSTSKALVNFMFTKMRFILGNQSTLYKLMNGQKVQSQRGEKNITFTFDNAFSNENVFKSIADIITANDPILLGDSVLGADGAKYYTIAQHTYISNTLDILKQNPDKLKQLKSAEINKRSKFIEAFEDNDTLQNFKMRTLSAIIREDTGDTGRGYQGISDLEDYLLRIIANNKGLLTPPTPADRRFYSFYEGVNKLDGSYNANGEISNETLEVFRGYYLDEVARAMLVRDQVERVIHGKMSANELIEGFHFKYIESVDIKPGDVIFDGTTVINVTETSNINPNIGYKLLKRKGSYTGRGSNMVIFNGAKVTDKVSLQDINSYIKEIIKREVLKANELGIIVADNEGNVIKNMLLPDSIVASEKAKVFAGSSTSNDTLAVESVIADSTINSMFAAIETTKVFTGDISAYKSFDDYVKRLPNYTSTGDNTRNDFPSTYYEGDKLVHSRTYNTAVFTSHIIESKYYDTLINKHADAYIAEGLFTDRDKALSKAKDRLEKLLEVDQTDAQTFISPAMYRATAIKLGEWNPQKEAAFNLLMGDRELTAEEYVLASEAVMQPLKMTYMNVHFENGHAIPVLDKQSMATMFRKVVKGTQMEDLLDRMEAVGKYSHLEPIQQVKFNTANKVGIKDRKRLFSDAEESSLTDLTTINSRVQYFDMLRKQLVTDPHDVSATLVGSQFKKVGMSNIEFDEIYSNGQTGRELITELHGTISELSNRGLENVIKEFNLSPDLKLQDKLAFVNKLKDEAKRANMPDYLVDSFKLNEDGSFYLEMDAHPGTRKWIQSRIISYIKKETIDLKLPGNVYIQMSNIGLRKVDKSDDLKFFNEKGNIECKVSVSLFSSLLPNDIKHDFDKSRKYLLEHPELTAMAYRIPTQAQDSTYTLEVVDFLPNSVGDVIVLPAEGTAIGGFDFKNIRVTA